MIIKPELVKKIKDHFNLNIYETRVWLALLSKGIASAGEIAELSGVPRSRTYDVLESLEKAGFAIEKIGKPTKYIAVKPTVVLEKLKRKELHKAQVKIKVLENLKATQEYNELEELHNTNITQIKKEDVSGAIKGKSAIYSHARALLENAEKEVLICMPACELLEKARIFNNLFEKLKNKKVNIKIALNGTEDEIKQVIKRHNIKPQRTKINSKMFIIDRKQILFNLTNSKNNEEELAVWLNTEFFSQALAKMFENSLRK
jgi:sugar-specific transcriptional regulator TrmB